MRLRGEDLLSEPRIYVRQIAEWLGLRTDDEATEAMLHPENSPFACYGPANAKFGNDPNLLEAVCLRLTVTYCSPIFSFAALAFAGCVAAGSSESKTDLPIPEPKRKPTPHFSLASLKTSSRMSRLSPSKKQNSRASSASLAAPPTTPSRPRPYSAPSAGLCTKFSSRPANPFTLASRYSR